jgi:hypothetical protein
MRYLFAVILMLAIFLCGVGQSAAASGQQQGAVNSQVQDLQEKMVADKDIMALILALRDDPEIQKLLNDPEIQKAVSQGDTGSLTANPRFMQLLNNPRVREIQQLMEK